MSIYKFFKCLAAGIILACFWVMIEIIFVGSLEIDQITIFWFIFFIMFIAKELP